MIDPPWMRGGGNYRLCACMSANMQKGSLWKDVIGWPVVNPDRLPL